MVSIGTLLVDPNTGPIMVYRVSTPPSLHPAVTFAMDMYIVNTD